MNRRFVEIARQAWREHRPKMYRALQRSGQLEAALRRAAQQASDDLVSGLENNLAYDQAWERAKDYLYLPSEEDQPRLGEPFREPPDEPDDE